MGISSDWREFLREDYPEAFKAKLPENLKFGVVIDDATSRLFSFVSNTFSYKDILHRFNRLISLNSKNTRKHIILFDESSPPNKRPKDGPPAITVEEAEREGFRVDVSGRYPQDPYRLLTTSFLKRDLYRFMGWNVCTIFTDPIETSLILDAIPSYDAQSNSNLIVGHARLYPSLEENGNEGNRVIIESPKLIGESDLKIPYHISRNRGQTILVINSDGDLLPILLLNMRDWINKESGFLDVDLWLYNAHEGKKNIEDLYKDDACLRKRRKVKAKKGKKANEEKVQLDLTQDMETDEPKNGNNAGSNQDEYVQEYRLIHLNTLFRSICSDFSDRYKTKHGVFIVTLLILMCENDFVNKIDGAGPKTIWDAFHDHGHKILTGKELQVKIGLNVRTKTIIPAEEVCDIDLQKIGEPNQKHSVGILEKRLVMFMKYVMQCQYIGTPKQLDYLATLDEIKESQAKRIKAAKEKNDKTRAKAIAQGKTPKEYNPKKQYIPTEAELNAEARRKVWNMRYWINGGKILPSAKFNYDDPLAVSPSGIPEWGWKRNAEGKVEPSKTVVSKNIDKSRRD